MLTTDALNKPSMPTWNGDNDKAHLFMEGFEAHADDNGFQEATTNGAHLPDKASDAAALTGLDTADDKIKLQACNANKKGMAHVTKVMTTAQ